MSERSQFVTRLGALAATVGSAVGLGNIWRFPYEAGEHGGGAFLIIYIACVMLVGIPVIVSEFVLGRGTHKNAIGALRQAAPGTRFYLLSWMGIIASILILSFYSVVCGWIVEYLIQSIAGHMQGLDSDGFTAMFNHFVASPWRCSLWTLLFLMLNFLVLRRGVQKGIERVANVAMPLLFVILIIFCIYALTLPDARKGLEFLLVPHFASITPKVVLGAMGQAFFSLSLGLTCLLTYASYFKDDEHLVRSATWVAVLDTLVALLAGVMIFPIVFSFGMQPEAGPKLVFEVLPNIFQHMPGGYVWSVLFFVLLFVASLTSTISMSEISITFFQEERHMSRNQATGLNTGIAMVLGVLCALSFNVLSDFTVCGKTLFDLFDFVSSNILLPLGGMFLAIMVGWVVDRRFVRDQLTNHGNVSVRSLPVLRFLIRWVAPVGIALIFLYGLGFFELF